MNKKGQSLVQTIVALGVMGIIMSGLITMQVFQQNTSNAVQANISRNMFQLQIQQTLMSSVAISKTLADISPGNLALKNCLQPTGNSCVQTTSPQGFNLLDASGLIIAGAGASSPVLYDYQGLSCTIASSRCVFQVYTEYSALCPGSISSCSNGSVSVTYTIRQDPNVNPFWGGQLKSIKSQPIPFDNPALSIESYYSRYGENRRCPNDLWSLQCSYNPGQDWARNYCNSRGHALSYGWSLLWDSAAGGYFFVCTGTGIFNNADCPLWGRINTDVLCHLQP